MFSLHFVDPVTGAHTQVGEGMWSACKRMRVERTMNSQLFDTFLRGISFGHIIIRTSEQCRV